MTVDDINLILAALGPTDVTECEIVDGESTLRLSFDRATHHTQASVPSESTPYSKPDQQQVIVLKTPSTGAFRRPHPLDDPTSADTSVQVGDHVGYVEIDSVFSAIVSPANGTVKRILLQEGELAGYGQPAIELDVREAEGAGNRNA
jgi:biotin carboxyl carrier protein